jgi:hypothetical protein
MYTKIYTQMVIAILFKKQEHPRCPSMIDEQNVVNPYNGYYLAIKKDGILIHNTTWMNLETLA